MYCIKKITDEILWVGGNDRRLALFENVFPLTRGVSYNSYLLIDEKTVLFDTVDKSVSDVFFENILYGLNGRKLDYIIVNHMEPDHCATLENLVLRYPDSKIVCNAKSLTMIKQFFNFDIDSRAIVVGEADVLCVGKHTLKFFMAPMVHWPEVMVTYDTMDKILFSADAFGTFGAIDGNIFADEVNFERDWLDEARRYYANIVGKYGAPVQSLLKKADTIDIQMICPLHGPILRKDISKYIEKYKKWSTYTPEENAVIIVYASIYGGTENVANIIACKLADNGIKNIKMYDVSVTHPSVIISESFRCSHIIFASATYNAGIFCNMENVIRDMIAHNLKNRTFAIVENGTWAPTAGNLIKNLLSELENSTILEPKISIKSTLKENQLDKVNELINEILNSLHDDKKLSADIQKIEHNALFKLSYGLFVLTARDKNKDNGCIINTAIQVTDSPKRVSFAVNKSNFTHDMIVKTKEFNLSVLTTGAPFSMYEHFGFQSGRDVNKFENEENAIRSNNGIFYIPGYTNAFISGKVIDMIEYETHTVFFAEITEAKVLSDVQSVTYSYYFENIKPNPQTDKKKGFVCKICGYIYDGETLPPDFICPICKHGVEDFEPLK